MKFYVALLSFALSSSLFAACKGGAGGTPFVDIDTPRTLSRVVSDSEIEDFVVTPKTHSLILRGPTETTEYVNFDKERKLPNVPGKLSRIMDIDENYLLTFAPFSFLGLNTLKLATFTHVPRDFRYVFSEDGIAAGVFQMDPENFAIAGLNPPYTEPEVFCTLGARHGRIPKLGRGHKFPYVVFYFTEDEGDTHHVWVEELDVRNCAPNYISFIDGDTNQTANFLGRITEAYDFASRRATGFRIDHPGANFAWWEEGSSCAYYAVGNAVFPNDEIPMFASLSQQKGLQIFDFSKNDKTDWSLLKELNLPKLEESDLWFSNHGDDIYLRARLDSQSQILKVHREEN